MQNPYDSQTRETVKQQMEQGDWAGLTEAFYKDLEFGTGGLRGIMGIGSNRINRYTLGKATQGFSNYLKTCYADQPIRVAVSYDSRNHSRKFARVVAEVFSGNGFQVYFFQELRPTPLLSFAIRELNCQAGVMLTASHNPKAYNGYKAYWADGGQLVAPHDRSVMDEVNKIETLDAVRFNPVPENIHILGAEMDQKYIQAICALSLRPDSVAQQADMKMVYSPLHGTGMPLVPEVLKAWGFTRVGIVEAQATPDGNFPTVIYPNPEEPEALALALQQAENTGADLVMATDPDADRVGVAVRDKDGKLRMLNGNQVACLLVQYVLEAYAEQGKLNGSDYVVKTIVTSAMIDAIAARYNTPCFTVLTGFKYIGELITNTLGEARFLVGGEESYGYLVGDLVRDKDAVISCAFIAEMAAYYRTKGSSLFEALTDLYLEYGLYKEALIALTREGKSGLEEIQGMMQRLRNQPPATLGGIPIQEVRDYKAGTTRNMRSGEVQEITLPRSDVLQFVTTEGDVLSARPSGTEPKIKFYCGVKAPLHKREELEQTEAVLEKKIKAIMDSVLQM